MTLSDYYDRRTVARLVGRYADQGRVAQKLATMAKEHHMFYAAIYELRQIVAAIILATPIILMAWGWIRLILRRASDPPMVSWIPCYELSLGFGSSIQSKH